MILLIGSRGRIGSRYRAILKDIAEPYIEHDIGLGRQDGDFDPECFDKCIIASPTETHFKYVMQMMDMKKPVLCEKPLSFELDQCEILSARQKKERSKAYLVNNWNFLVTEGEKIRSIEYDYYNTGPDGFAWDLAQPIYLGFKNNARLHLDNKSPTWDVRINNESVQHRDLEWTYLDMIHAFIKGDYELLWTMQDGLQMTKCIHRYMEEKKYA